MFKERLFMKNTVKRLWTYMEGWRGLVFALCAILPLAASAFAAENSVLFFGRWFFIISIACFAVIHVGSAMRSGR